MNCGKKKSPNFTLVAAKEEVLAWTPLVEHKLESRPACGSWYAGQEVQHSLHLTQHQMGKHHQETLNNTGKNGRVSGKNGHLSLSLD